MDVVGSRPCCIIGWIPGCFDIDRHERVPGVGFISFGQLAVLAVWLTLGTGHAVFRLAIYFTLGILATAIGMNGVIHGVELLIVAAVQSTVMMLVVSLPLSILRVGGWRLVGGSAAYRDGAPWQISTRLILALTFLVALLLTLHRLVTLMGIPNDDGSIGFPNTPYSVLPFIIASGVTAIGMSMSVASAVWSCLAARGYWSGLPTTLLVVALVAAFPMHASVGSRARMQWSAMIATTMLTVVLSLLFLRRCGVRAVRGPGRLA